MTVEVVMSWRDHGCEYRRRNFEWVFDRWASAGFDVAVHGAEDGHGWCRAADVTPLIEASSADIIVCADADVWCDGIHEAVAAVEAGAAWAVPHLMLCRLDEASSANVLAGGRPEDQEGFTERPYKGHPGGTLFVIRRDVYLDCPLDPRFVEWGQEDDAFALALDLLHGKPWRGKQPCWHLFHPPQPRKNRAVGNDENLKLYRRYRMARHDPVRIRALVDEAKEVWDAELRRASLDGQPLPS